MAIEPIKGFYVHDEATDTDGVAKYDYDGLFGAPNAHKVTELTNSLVIGTVYTNYDIGSTIDPSNGNPSAAAWRHLVVPCKTGESFTIKGFGGDSARFWAFTDSNYVLLSKAENGAYSYPGLKLTASADGYFIYNSQIAKQNPDPEVIYAELLDILDIEDRTNTIETSLDDIEEKANEAWGNIFQNVTEHPATWEEHGISSDGTISTATNRIHSPFIKVSAGAIVSVETGYKFNIAEYSAKNIASFIIYNAMGTTPYTVQNDGYILVGVGFTDSDSITTSESTSILTVTQTVSNIDVLTNATNALEDLLQSSPYKKDINFGDYVSGWYKGLQNSYDVSTLRVGYETFIRQWDDLISDCGDYVTKSNLGDSSYTPEGVATPIPVYLYDFKPINASTKIPKIIIVAGHHGYEKGNAFGLFYFMKDLLENWNESEVLAYLRAHVRIMVIPFLNPFGFDTGNYYNQNHVNINRNYDANWSYAEPGEQGSGDKPFDQPESQIVRDLIENNSDAFFFIDSHSIGSTKTSDYRDLNIPIIPVISDNYFNKLIEACKSQIANNTIHLADEFGLDVPSGYSVGRVSVDTAIGTAKSWVASQNILAVTLEGTNGFPSDTDLYSDSSVRANAEMICNSLIQVINTYRCL